MQWMISAIAALFVSLFMFYVSRVQKRRDAATEKRAEVRKEESLLLLKLNAATAKMASTAANVLQHGLEETAIEEAIAELDEVCDTYTEFMNRQAKTYMYK